MRVLIVIVGVTLAFGLFFIAVLPEHINISPLIVIVAIIGVVVAPFYNRKYIYPMVAAKNILLAKHTYDHLNEDKKKDIAEKCPQYLELFARTYASNGPKELSGLSETQKYSLYASIMKNLNINPSIQDEYWGMVGNATSKDMINRAATYLEKAKKEILRKHKIDITIPTS